MRRCAVVIGASGALLAAGSVVAETGSFWSISAATPGGTPSTWLIPSDAVAEQGSFSLDLGSYGRVSLNSRGLAGRGTDDDCRSIQIGLAVSAGGAPTQFTISSALLSFPTTGNTFGRLTGMLKVTDLTDDGASVTGALSNGDSVGGFVNGFGEAGTLVTSAFASLTAPAGGMNSDSFDSGCITLTDISNMSMVWSFTLSPLDHAQGSALWAVCDDCGTVVPLPGAAGLGLVGFGLVASRRRRAS